MNNLVYTIKKLKKIPGRVYLRYALYQLPGLALAAVLLWWLMRLFAIPGGYIFILLGLWLLKDFVMFPFVWQSYDNSTGDVLEKMIGKTGIAVEDIDPEGYVRISGEMWKAEIPSGEPPVKKGDSIIVASAKGLLLTVKASGKR